jgi:hypothetical protein
VDVDTVALSFLDEKPERVRMDSVTGYAQTLRAIGQALEILNVGDFNVEPDGDSYRINGTSSVGKYRRDPWTVNPPAVRASAMELSYTPSDVERLNREGRNQRANVHGTTDSSRLSQALRVIGTYLTLKYSRLLRISRGGDSFEVHYQSSLGSRFSEQFSSADLYDLWVRFYIQRSMRTAS